MLFAVGAVGFLAQVVREKPSEAMIYGSLILMGVPFVQRIDNPPTPPQRDDDEDPPPVPSPPEPPSSG